MIPLFSTVPCRSCAERSQILKDALAEGKTWFEAIGLMIVAREKELREQKPTPSPPVWVGGKLKGP